MNDKIKQLYDVVGQEYDLGTYDEFKARLQQDDSRKKFYDVVGQEYDLGDYGSFSSIVTSYPDSASPAPSAPSAPSAEEVAEEMQPKDETRFGILGKMGQYMGSPSAYVPMPQAEEREELTQAEIDQRAAMRQMLQESGTIDRMEEMEKEARKSKFKAFGEALAYTPQVSSFGVASNIYKDTEEQLADAQRALEASEEHRQNKAMEQTLDVALDKARAGEWGGIGENNVGNGVVDFGLGLWDSATRMSTWDFGVSDTLNGLTIAQVVKKWDEDPESLTATERNLLDAMGMATAVQEAYADQTGIGYSVGESLPQSAGFMASMYLNPASGLGKSLARQAVKKYGRQSIAKNLARIGGDIAETAIMTATTGGGRVVADALDRINGQSTYEIDPETGIVMYGGQKDQETVGQAALKAIGSNFIENYSEALGEYFDPLLGMSRRLAAGGLRKMNLDKWADALSDVQPSQMAASIRSLREKAKFGGVFGEIMEEEVGMALNAITVGDYTFSKEEADASNGKKQWIFDLENQLTTALSCAIMSGAMTGVETIGNVGYRREMERSVADAEKVARAAVGDEMIAQIDQASPEGMVDILRDAYMDQNLSLQQKRVLAEYATQRVRMQYYNAADAKARRQVNVTQQNAIDAYEAGRHAQLPQYYNIDQEYRRSEAAINERENAEEIWDAIRLMNNMDENERQDIMRDFSEEDQELIRNWRYNAYRWQGAINHRAEQVEDLVDEYAGQVNPYVVEDKQGNRNVTTAVYGDNVVYVMAQNADGATTIVTNDGRKKMVNANELEHVQTHNADELIERFRQQTTEVVNQETEKNLSYPSEVQEPVQGVTVETLDGKQWQVAATDGENVEIVGLVFDKKSGQWIPNAGDYRKMTREQFMDWQKAELDRKKANTYEQGDKLVFYVNGEPIDAEITGIDPDGNYMVQISHLADGLDKSVSDVYTAEELRKLTTPSSKVSEKTTENESTPTEEIKQSVSEEVTNSQIGENVKKTTAEVAESVNTAQTKAAELLAELDEDEVDENIAYNTQKAIDLAEEKRKARPTMKEADGDVATYKALKAKWEAELNELQRGVLFWSNVAKEVSNARAASQTIVPEVEAEAEQPAVVQPMDMNPQPAKKAKKSRKREPVSFDGLSPESMAIANGIMADMAPQNGVELAAAMMSTGGKRIIPESFRKHTGYSTTEQKSFLGLIAGADKGGLTIEHLGELVMQADREDGTNFFDQNDANAGLNAVLEVLGQAETIGDVNDYIKRNREEAAYREAWANENAMLEAEQEAKDAWYMEQYGATEEELIAYNELMNEIVSDYAPTEEELQNVYSIFAEQQLEYGNEGTTESISRPTDSREGQGETVDGDNAVGEGDQYAPVETAVYAEGGAAEAVAETDAAVRADADVESNPTANYFEMAEEAQKKRKSKQKSNDKLAEKNHQQKENRSETRGVGNRPQLQDASSYESFVERVSEYPQRSYKGTGKSRPSGTFSISYYTQFLKELFQNAHWEGRPSEEVAGIIRRHNAGKTLLARTEDERELLSALRALTNNEIQDELSNINNALQSDEYTDEEKEELKRAKNLITRFVNRGERNAVIEALTGAKLGEKLPLSKIDELFEMYNSDANVAELYGRVRAIAEQIGLDFWFEEMEDRLLGGYLHSDNRVRLNAHMLYCPRMQRQGVASTIVHEMLHAVAGYAVYTQKDIKLGLTPKVRLSKQVLSAANTIINIYEKAVKGNPALVHQEYDIEKEEWVEVADYGTTSVHEMLSEISNPEFRDKLKQIEYKNRSVWQWIVDTLKSMFTRSSDVANPTAYDSMAKALDVLINEFSVDAYQKYSGLEESASRVSRGGDERTLAGLHNISEDKLKKAIKQGGLANPSIAVIDLETQGHTNFGDITLVAPSSLIDKKSGRNAGTYLADAWTPTYPAVKLRLDDKGWKKVKEYVDSVTDEPKLRADMRYGVEQYLNGYGAGYSNMQYAFLKESGVEIPIARKRNDGYISDEEFKALVGMGAQEASNGSMEAYKKFKELPQDVQNEVYIWAINHGNKAAIDKVKERIKSDERYAKLYEDEVSFSQFNSLAYDTFRRERDNGEIDVNKTFREASDYVSLNGLAEQFDKWLSSKLEEAGAKEMLFAGFDNMGNAKYVPNTLENASKLMKKEGKVNAYNDTGHGSTRAVLAEKVGTLEKIRRNKGKLQDEEAVKEAYEAFKDMHWAIIDKVHDQIRKSGNEFMDVDNAAKIVNYALASKNPVRELENDGYVVDDELGEMISDFVKYNKQMPVPYFETKFERPVMLDEFYAAVIPSDTDADIVRALESAGLSIETYERGNEESRKEAVDRMSDENVRFRDGAPFFSNAERAVENIKQNKATPEQWLAMIKKDGGLKAGEDKWMGLSDWLNEQKAQGVKTLTKDEVLQFIRENQIEIEEVNYAQSHDYGYDEDYNAIAEEIDDAWDDYVYEAQRGLVSYGQYRELDDVPMEQVQYHVREKIKDIYGDDIFDHIEIDEDGNVFVLGDTKPINSTRLDYTTEGLDNKREIALVVPTIEPWNQTDTIHFGDAGEGRAVAWVRFGETTTPREEKYVREVKLGEPYKNFSGDNVYPSTESKKDYIVHKTLRDGTKKFVPQVNERPIGDTMETAAFDTLEEAKEAMSAYYKEHPLTKVVNERVLVIDEVQSKRHDEGRSKGYKSNARLKELEREYDALIGEQVELTKEILHDAGYAHKSESEGVYNETMQLKAETGLIGTDEQRARYNDLSNKLYEVSSEQRKLRNSIPDAPFDKNYHELVMKRMLRYAAENGFDKVAWTKGKQQARRYNLAHHVTKIGRYDINVSERRFTLGGNTTVPYKIIVNDEGVVMSSTIEGVDGKNLSEVVGKEMAEKMMQMPDKTSLEGADLYVGGEDRNALYDEMIPRFMNKYTKKWGTKVGEVTLPNVEEDGRTMWSVDVTDAMRESVMQGQPMFREGMGAVSDREVSYENDPIAKWQGKPRYYGKRAAAFAERERARMQKGVEEAAKILGIEVEIITDASTLKGRKAKAKGWYDINAKKVVVVIPNHVSKGDAVRTVLHEGVAHHGLRELFGDGFDAMLDNIYNNVAPELKARIDAIAERTGVSTSVATEEYLASLAEETNFEEAKNMGWWAKIKNYFVKMLNKLGMPGLNLKEEITDNELRYLLWRSYQNLVDPNSYLKPLGYIDDVAKQKELKVGNYAENTMATPRVAEMSEAEEWSAITMQRIEELEAQAAQLENEIADMEAKREADDASRYEMWDGLMMPIRMQLEDTYSEIEGLYTLSGEEEVNEEEREAEKQRQLYQKRIDNAYLKAVREGNWEEATDLFRQYVLSKAEDEGIVPMDYGVGYRGGAHSSIAKKVKEENPDAIAEAAYQMSIRIPKGSILVPMPSRTGNATYTVKLAEAIAKATDSEVRDVLKGKARMSVYEAKQKGIKMAPEDLGMYTTEELPKGKNIVIIDNVIDKGTTALAAVSAVKGASVVAYAYTLGDKQRVATLKLAEPVTYDDNKRIIPLSQRFNKESDDIRYRMSINEEEFDKTQREAVKNIGIVMPNLGDAEVNIVDVPRHDFTGTGNEAISKAKEWANRELVGEHVANEGTKEEFKYSIDEKSVKKFLSGVSTSLSDNLGVHLSVLKKLPSVIDSSIEAEIHADYKKGEQRDANNGIEDENLLIHRLYGCAKINGELYRVKTTIKERKSAGVKPYTYEVTKIELLDGSSQEGTSSSDASSNSISGAKLLKGVEKSYDKGKLLLDESKRVSENSINSEEIIAEVEREAAALGVPVRIARSVDELIDDEGTRKRAVDGQLKGYFNPRTGEVVVYEPNTDNANDAKRTVLHEIVGHKGLRQLIGEERYDKAMVQLMYMLPSEVRDAVLRRAERHGWNAAIAMDEYLAEQAERDVQPTWWGKVNAKIRALLRNIGFNVKLTDADVTYLLWRSRKKLMGDTAFDMATDAILKQAARKSVNYDAESDNAIRHRGVEQGKKISEAVSDYYEKYTATTNADKFWGGVKYMATHLGDGGTRALLNDLSESQFEDIRSVRVLEEAIESAEGKPLRENEMVHKSLNAKTSRDARDMDKSQTRYFQPMAKLLGKILGKKIDGRKIEIDDVERYLICKHSPENNEFLMKRAHAENRRKKIHERAKELMKGTMTEEEAIAQATSEYTLHQSDFRDDYSGLTELFPDEMVREAKITERTEELTSNGVDEDTARHKASEEFESYKPTLEDREKMAADEVARFEAAVDGLHEELWGIINGINRDTIERLFRSGLISRSLYNDLKKRHKFYVPLSGWKNDAAADIYNYVTNGFDTKPLQTVIKKAEGTKYQARNILGSMFAMNMAAITEGNQNLVKQKLYNLALNHDTGVLQIVDLWEVKDGEGDAAEWKPAPKPELRPTMSDAEMQKALTDYQNKLMEMEKDGKARKAVNSLADNFGKHTTEKEAKRHHVELLVNGRKVVIWVNGNPKLAQAINGDLKVKKEMLFFNDAVDKANRFLAQVQTSLNPEFMISNFERDILSASRYNLIKYGPKYEASFMKHLSQLMPLTALTDKNMRGGALDTFGIFRLFALDRNTNNPNRKPDAEILDMNNPLHREFANFLNYGGKTGYVERKQAEDLQQRIKKLSKREQSIIRKYPAEVAGWAVDTIERMNEGIENATRFAAYLAARERGKSVTEAVFEAKEVSVNFNMQGSGAWGNASYRKLYNYFNVGLQALRREKNLMREAPKPYIANLAFMTSLGVIATILLTADWDGDDEDEYMGLSDFNRYNYINIKTKDGFIHYSLPQDLRAFYAIGCISTEWAMGKIDETRAMQAYMTQANNYTPLSFVSTTIDREPDSNPVKNLAMSFVPSAAVPVAEIAVNEDFLGRRINNQNQWNKYEPEWQRAGYRTPEWVINASKALSEAGGGTEHKRGVWFTEINPSNAWHVMDSYGGGFLDFAQKTYNLVERVFAGKEHELRDYPMVSKFYVESGQDYSKQRVVNDRYRMYREDYETIDNELNGYLKDKSNALGKLSVRAKEEGLPESVVNKERAEIEKTYEDNVKRVKESPNYWIYESFVPYEKGYNKLNSNLGQARKYGSEQTEKELSGEMYNVRKKLVDEIDAKRERPIDRVRQWLGN